MRTYWFTVAVGREYEEQARALVASARRHGITVHILNKSVERRLHSHPKSLKIQGILDAPAWADRIMFLDSDTLLLDPTGHEEQCGAVYEPWTRPDSKLVGRKNISAYEYLIYNQYPSFAASKARRRSWNSGVIMGPREWMIELAQAWLDAYMAVLKVTNGTLHRDQASFRLAYESFTTLELQPEWNWILKRHGVRDDVHILHAGGEPIGPGKKKQWERLKERIL